MSGVNLQLDAEAFRPLIAAVVEQALAAAARDRAALDGRLAYSEAEAARLLSLHPWQLRDCRLRGEILASVGPARKILYSREDLLNYLAARRWEAK